MKEVKDPNLEPLGVTQGSQSRKALVPVQAGRVAPGATGPIYNMDPTVNRVRKQEERVFDQV